MKKIGFGIIGMVLVAAVILTGSYGLSKKNIEIYENAVALQEKVKQVGFEDFLLTDYPVTFYDGDYDYVVTWRGDNYDIEKRKAVLNFVAATAYPVEDHYEVHTPTVEKMSSLVNLVSQGDGEYGMQEQVSTIWHEAFHCYQLTNYLAYIEAICPGGMQENLIAEKIDANKDAVTLFMKQSALLEGAKQCKDIDKLRADIVEYKRLEEKRNAILTEESVALEDYYVRVEGTAYYVESCICQMQNQKQYEENYLQAVDTYQKGTTKYYRRGMLQCMILNQLSPEWKQGYDFSESMMELIYKELDIS